MKKVSKQKSDVKHLTENVSNEVLPQSHYSLESCLDQIKEIIDSGRKSALEVVSEMMCITFEETVDLLQSKGIGEEDLTKDRIYISNLLSTTLATMLVESKKGSLRDYILGKNKASFIISFLDFRTISKESLQGEYKKAYEKWSLEEEMILTGLYNEGKSWKEISEHLQRNINAIKIRIEKLGLATDTGAKRRF